MADIPTIEPSEIVAGDTLKFKKSLSDYPATTWTLTYYLLKSGTQITFSGTAEGTIIIKTNLVTQTTGYDARSHVKTVLDALESLLEGKASRDVMNITIGGQSISK